MTVSATSKSRPNMFPKIAVKELNFTATGQLSEEKTIMLFQSAHVIVSPFGSALSNLIFSPPFLSEGGGEDTIFGDQWGRNRIVLQELAREGGLENHCFIHRQSFSEG